MSDLTASRAIPTDIAGKLEKAINYKDEGNRKYGEKEYKKAISCYGKAIAFTKGLPGSKRGLQGVGEIAAKAVQLQDSVSPEEEKKAIDIETVVETNISMCFLKLEKYSEALSHADKALVLTPSHTKAMIRKAEALIGLRNYDAATEQLQRTLQLTQDETQIKTVKTLLVSITKKEKEEEKKQRKQFAGIFERAHAKDDA